MFRKTAKEQQLGIFSANDNLLSGKSKDYYEQADAWHNIFRKEVTMRVDETLFSKLFSNKMGAPNAPVRILISMMILKEAYGWSDAQLFEHCRYHVLVRSALGLLNMDDAIPTESTYYLFRKRMVDYEKTTNINIIEEAFASITKGQARDFEVSGKSIRMDSKLLSSNIAWYSRYELVHETLRLFYKELKSADSFTIDSSLREQLDMILKEEGTKVVFRHSRDEIKLKLQQIGMLIDKLLDLYTLPESTAYQTLCKVFTEQYRIDENKLLVVRDKEEITSGSVQSPHDPDSHYRNKNGNHVKGYSINVTESCDKDELHLIADIDVRPVTAGDNYFLQDGVKQSQQTFTDKIENVHADGAYHSPENQQYCKEEEMNLYLTGMHGSEGRYNLELTENGELIVTDRVTGKNIPSKKVKGQQKWGIKLSNHNRYFTHKEINNCATRKQIQNLEVEIKNVRNNVEATLFQMGYHYPHDRSRYRGLSKHAMWAHIRGLWVNFVRILKHVKETLHGNGGTGKKGILFTNPAYKILFYEVIFVLKGFLKIFFLKHAFFVLSQNRFSDF